MVHYGCVPIVAEKCGIWSRGPEAAAAPRFVALFITLFDCVSKCQLSLCIPIMGSILIKQMMRTEGYPNNFSQHLEDYQMDFFEI